MRVDTFLSCSFDPADEAVNNHFKAVLVALDFDLANVSNAFTETPPQVAKGMIQSADCLVAICTKRDALTSGKFVMPQAVHDEISFGYATEVPVLMFVEDGVDLKGFKSNFGTYQAFDRSKLAEADHLQNVVKSIYGLRSKITGENRVKSQGAGDSYAERMSHMLELRKDGDDYVWIYATSKKLVYLKNSSRAFSTGVWATIPSTCPDDAKNVEWSFDVKSASHNLSLAAEIEKQTPGCVEVQMRPTPSATTGDFIEYATVTKGRYINPLWSDEVAETSVVHLDDCDKTAADGMIFIHPTKSAVIEVRFPAEYGLTKADLRPFVGSYTQNVDYEVATELERAKVRIDDFAGALCVRMEVESPLLNHMYGVAWNPLPRPAAKALRTLSE